MYVSSWRDVLVKLLCCLSTYEQRHKPKQSLVSVHYLYKMKAKQNQPTWTSVTHALCVNLWRLKLTRSCCASFSLVAHFMCQYARTRKRMMGLWYISTYWLLTCTIQPTRERPNSYSANHCPSQRCVTREGREVGMRLKNTSTPPSKRTSAGVSVTHTNLRTNS